jgi:hypothetical protein
VGGEKTKRILAVLGEEERVRFLCEGVFDKFAVNGESSTTRIL